MSLLAQTGDLRLPSVEYSAISPLLVLVGGALAILLLSSLTGRRLPEAFWTAASVVTAAGGLATSIWVWQLVSDGGPRGAIANAVLVDGYSIWFAATLSVAVGLFSLLAHGYVRREGLDGPEVHVLALLSVSGGVLMAYANDLLVLFLGLEILSISLYVLAGYHRRRAESGEAALKYFLLGSFASAVFLYGVALTYGATGSTRLDQVLSYLLRVDPGRPADSRGLLLLGMVLMLVGLGFKVAAVPFHTWTPDVYQGAPSPVTGFMAAAAKAAGFAGLLRLFVSALGPVADDWRPVVWVLAALTLVVGAVLAIAQDDVKRMLAYSSINHAGYVLVGLYAANPEGLAGAQYYVLTYGITVLGTFAVVTVVGQRGDHRHSIGDYRGLYQRRPFLAVAMTVLLAAQAGVPFTTGFLAKFSVIRAATSADDWVLGVLAMLVTAIAAYFYLRLILAMFTPVVEEPDGHGGGDEDAGTTLVRVRAKARADLRVPATATVVVVVSLLVTVVAGIWADPLLDLAERATVIF